MKRHIIISGTGRTGTTFLVELLTDLGLDTGFRRNNVSKRVFKGARAGLEKNIRSPKAPYIIKSPTLCNRIGKILERRNIAIDHAFVPIRDLKAATESRIRVFKARGQDVKGGLWDTKKPSEQKSILAVKLHQLLLGLSKQHIPVTFINYPKLTKDPQYLFGKLEPILNGMEFGQFKESFDRKIKPKWVHKYNDKDI